jgi:hypothetical protein
MLLSGDTLQGPALKFNLRLIAFIMNEPCCLYAHDLGPILCSTSRVVSSHRCNLEK